MPQGTRNPFKYQSPAWLEFEEERLRKRRLECKERLYQKLKERECEAHLGKKKQK